MANLSKFPYFVIAFVLSSLSTVDLAMAVSHSSRLPLSSTGSPYQVSPSLSPARQPIPIASLWDNFSNFFGPGDGKGGTRGDSYCSLTFPAGRKSKILGDRFLLSWHPIPKKEPVSQVQIEDFDSKAIVWQSSVVGQSQAWVTPSQSWQEGKTYRVVFRRADGSDMDSSDRYDSPRFQLAPLAERQQVQQSIQNLHGQERAKTLAQAGFRAEAIAVLQALPNWPQLQRELIQQECPSSSFSKK